MKIKTVRCIKDSIIFSIHSVAIDRILSCSSPTETADLLALYTIFCERSHKNQSTRQNIIARELGWTEWKVNFCTKLLTRLQLLEDV